MVSGEAERLRWGKVEGLEDANPLGIKGCEIRGCES